MGERLTTWVDDEGRKHRVWLPSDAPEDEAPMGVPAGPPSLESLGLPLDIEVRLHNELYNRRLFTAEDLRKNRASLQAAVVTAFRTSVEKIMAIYHGQTEV